ncbi:MAG: hypothetical protein ABIO94_11500 [Opitutaceae bacterium]
MTVFELLTVIAGIGAAYFVGSWLGATYGILGWIVGIVLGACGFVAAYALFRSWLRKR